MAARPFSAPLDSHSALDSPEEFPTRLSVWHHQLFRTSTRKRLIRMGTVEDWGSSIGAFIKGSHCFRTGQPHSAYARDKLSHYLPFGTWLIMLLWFMLCNYCISIAVRAPLGPNNEWLLLESPPPQLRYIKFRFRVRELRNTGSYFTTKDEIVR